MLKALAKNPLTVFASLRESYHFIKRLREEVYDLALDFHGLLRSTIFLLFSRSRKRFGYSRWPLPWLNFRFYPRLPQNVVLNHIELAQKAGISVKNSKLEIYFKNHDKEYIQRLLQNYQNQPIVVLHPFTSWKTKNWPLERFEELASILIREFNATVVFTGSARERSFIKRKISKLLSQNVLILAGKTTLTQLAALISLSQGVVAGDTFTLHLAAVWGIPSVGLFGPSNPMRSAPWQGNCRVIWKRLQCSPCYRGWCWSKKCLKEIKIEEVLKAIKELDFL
jgi:lipopolysaccharide heptosyltransferase II